MAKHKEGDPQVDRSTCNYRWMANKGPNRCQNCEYFHPGPRDMNSCDHVFGLVHPMYGCDDFEQKPEAVS